jgi:hypothetical protein
MSVKVTDPNVGSCRSIFKRVIRSIWCNCRCTAKLQIATIKVELHLFLIYPPTKQDNGREQIMEMDVFVPFLDPE